MKILVVQLARLGDILMTWPQVRALKRLHPDAEIDMLVRPRFKEATLGLQELHRVIEFPMEKIFEPLFEEPLNLEQSLSELQNIISELQNNNYDWIINNTLSPASSYLCNALETKTTRMTGYTRTSDGFLSIKDDVSSYIYAQVGIDRDNRIHLSDLFTLMVDAQPLETDWKTPTEQTSPIDKENYIVLHIGASQPEKKYSAFKWRTFITHFQKLNNYSFVLIGSSEDIKDAEFVSLGFNPDQIINLTGKISFQELFPLIAHAKLYIGCDSAPLHVASLVGTQSLNISLSAVNFWETGPRAPQSRILYAETEADLPSETIAREAASMLANEIPKEHTITLCSDKKPCYAAPPNTRNHDWTWNLISAIYMDTPWPPIDTQLKNEGIKSLRDVNQVILEQLQTIRNTNNISIVSSIIERCEEVIENVGKLVKELSPLIRWYQTQKALIEPGSRLILLDKTEKVHNDFGAILEYWSSLNQQQREEENGAHHT